MKKLIFILLLMFTIKPLDAGVVAFGKALFKTSTRYFTIVYPQECSYAANRVASFADFEYLRISSLFNVKKNMHITVIITPDTAFANGMTTIVPDNYIVLYDILPAFNSTIANNDDYLRMLFTHELTHAISLNIAEAPMKGLKRIFGNWVSPQLYMMPWFMIEGVAVNMESLDGTGRVHLPIIREQVMQDILEGRFKGLSQASGAYDLYPYGNVFYHYGGLFNNYIMKTYGKEKYAALWHETGHGNFFTLLPGAFRKTYGISLRQAWKNFKKTMTPQGYFATNKTAVPGKHIIRAAVSDGRDIYYFDAGRFEIRRFDSKTRKDSLLLRTDSSIERLTLSSDGRVLWISMAAPSGRYTRKMIRAFDLKHRRWMNTKFYDLSDAFPFQKGIIAIRHKGIKSALVYHDKNHEYVLLKGGPSRVYGTPCAIDKKHIALEIKDKGRFYLGIYSMDTKTIDILQSSNIRFLRDLTVQNKRLYFSYNNDNGFYKLATYDTDTKTLTLQTNEVFGGVFNPVSANGKLYAVGRFSQGEHWTLLNRLATIQTQPSETNIKPIKKTFLPADFQATGRYHDKQYLSPKVWTPIFLYNNGRIDNLGIATFLMDPTMNNVIIPIFTYNFQKPFLNVSLQWNNSTTPLDISMKYSDFLNYNPAYDYYQRQMSLRGSVSKTWRFSPMTRAFLLGMNVSWNEIASGSQNTPVYTWPMSPSSLILGWKAVYSDFAALYNYFDYRGWAFTGYFDLNTDKNKWKTEASLLWSPDRLPLLVTLQAAYSPEKIFNYQGWNSVFYGTHAMALPSYLNRGGESDLYAVYNARYSLFHIDIQTGPGLFPLYFQRIAFSLGDRGASLGNDFVHSTYIRAEIDSVVWYNIPVTTFIESAYAWNNPVPTVFYFGINVNIQGLTGEKSLRSPEKQMFGTRL